MNVIFILFIQFICISISISKVFLKCILYYCKTCRMFLNLSSIFYILLIFSSILMIWASNPIYAVFFFISVFLNTSVIFILFNIDFIGILLLLVYVGAIAILVLFIIMMVNLKKVENEQQTYMLISFLICLLFLSVNLYINRYQCTWLFSCLLWVVFIMLVDFNGVESSKKVTTQKDSLHIQQFYWKKSIRRRYSTFVENKNLKFNVVSFELIEYDVSDIDNFSNLSEDLKTKFLKDLVIHRTFLNDLGYLNVEPPMQQLSYPTTDNFFYFSNFEDRHFFIDFLDIEEHVLHFNNDESIHFYSIWILIDDSFLSFRENTYNLHLYCITIHIDVLVSKGCSFKTSFFVMEYLKNCYFSKQDTFLSILKNHSFVYLKKEYLDLVVDNNSNDVNTSMFVMSLVENANDVNVNKKDISLQISSNSKRTYMIRNYKWKHFKKGSSLFDSINVDKLCTKNIFKSINLQFCRLIDLSISNSPDHL